MSALAKQLGASKEDVSALFYELCDELLKWDVMSVAEEAEMHFTTLYNWLRGKNKGKLESIVKVGRVMGMELQ